MMLGGLTLDTFIRELAEAIVECMAARDASLVSQRDRRGLIGRRHIDAVKRRIEEQSRSGGERDAFIRGRDFLLTPAAVRDELARGSAPAARNDNAGRPRIAKAKTKSPAAVERDELARLKRELEADMRAAREQ
jgi:hypothetical protein